MRGGSFMGKVSLSPMRRFRAGDRPWRIGGVQWTLLEDALSRSATLTVNDGLAVLRISRDNGNALNGELVSDLTATITEAASRDDVRGVLLAAAGKLFSPGLDLRELIELDRPAMESFVAAFGTCVTELYAFEKPLVAALHGHAVAGGCVISLAADWRILAEGALIGLNEVRVGVPLPFGVAMMLRESVPTRHLEEIALFGLNYRGDEALAAGLVHEVRPTEGFEGYCLSRLEELASRDSLAFSTTKRYLRAATVERMRAHDAELAGEFIEGWFSPPTRERMRAIVDDLKK